MFKNLKKTLPRSFSYTATSTTTNNNTCEKQSHSGADYSSTGITGPQRIAHTHTGSLADGMRDLQGPSSRDTNVFVLSVVFKKVIIMNDSYREC